MLSKVVKNIVFQNKTLLVMVCRHNKTFWYQFCNFKHFLKAENFASWCVEFYIGLSCNPVWDWVTTGTSFLQGVGPGGGALSLLTGMCYLPDPLFRLLCHSGVYPYYPVSVPMPSPENSVLLIWLNFSSQNTNLYPKPLVILGKIYFIDPTFVRHIYQKIRNNLVGMCCIMVLLPPFLLPPPSCLILEIRLPALGTFKKKKTSILWNLRDSVSHRCSWVACLVL